VRDERAYLLDAIAAIELERFREEFRLGGQIIQIRKGKIRRSCCCDYLRARAAWPTIRH
jgi:hypothetical protein